jgi:hypothetical protein
MKTLKNNPITMICLLAGLCAAALIAFVTAYAAPTPSTIQACYNNTTGSLRRVNSASDCRYHETPISWSVAGPAGPQGPSGPQGPTGAQGTCAQGPACAGANIVTFRHTRTVANTCGPFNNFSVMDNPSINGNANALVFVTAIIGINAGRSNTNPNSSMNLTYTGSASFGTCPAGRWIVAGGDIATGAQFNVMVVGP